MPLSDSLDNHVILTPPVTDDAEYPRVAYLNGKCINIVADLWHSPDPQPWKSGAVTGSNEEACMMAATATWLQWRKRILADGRVPSSPNFVITAQHSPIWDNFSRLWKIEMRSPSTPSISSADSADSATALTALCDDDTICIIHAVSDDYATFDPSALLSLDKAVTTLNADRQLAVPIHIDAGDAGLTLPFTSPASPWDFRLDRVASISAYSPVGSALFPGTGFVCWRDRSFIPDGMVFAINYLGTEISQIGLNFSHPSAGLLDHYSHFIRLGHDAMSEAVRSAVGDRKRRS